MKKIFTLLSFVALGISANAQIVINEVYGGGGATSGTPSYKNDFVELINIGSTAASLTGATLQYSASGATSTFNSYVTLPNLTLQPSQIFLVELVQVASGSNVILGPDLPIAADFVATTNTSFNNGTTYNGGLAMSGTNGRIALASNGDRVVNTSSTNVLDFVGWGTSTIYEGTGAAPALSTILSAQRKGLVDTNDNAADFEAKTPTPENKITSLSTGDIAKLKFNLVRNTKVTNEINFGEKANVKIYSVTGELVKSASVEKNTSLNVSSLPKGIYVVTGEVNGQSVSQKIVKQ